MSTATRMWSKEGVSVDGGKTINVEGWHIVDAADKATALATSGLPQYNDPQSSGSSYRVRRVSISNYNGPTHWLATIEYAIPENGNFPNNPEDPLLKPIVWNVQPITIGRASETDAYRKRKINSAGDVFPPEQAQYRRYRLTGRRYEAFWNDAKCRFYDQKTNSNAMQLGRRTILPYECLCLGIYPVGEFEDDSDYLQMEYSFEIGTDERASVQGAAPEISGFPFDSHFVDQGNRGWFTDGSTTTQGRFCRVNSNDEFLDYAENVILNGTGKPIDTTIKVTDFQQLKIYTPVANPTQAQWLIGAPANAGNVQSPYSTATIPQWLYFNHQAVSFQNILSL